MKLQLTSVVDLQPTSRIKTQQGFLFCKDARLAKPMVKDYYAAELGAIDGFEPTDIIKIYTSPAVLFADAVIQSFEGADITIRHPKGNQLTANNYRDYVIGTAKNVRTEDGYLVADLTIKDSWAVDSVLSKEAEQLSLGYSLDLEVKDGVTDAGQPYHAIVTTMIGDHIAIVEKGRCGDDCRIADQQTVNQSNPKKEQSMKVTVNGIEFDVGDNAPLAQAINNQTAELNTLKQANVSIGDQAFNVANPAEAKAMQAVINTLVGDKKTLSDKVADLEKTQVTAEKLDALVADRVATIEAAKQLNDKLDTTGKTSEAIKREVVTAKAGDALVKAIVGDDASKAEAATIDIAFKALLATADSQTNVPNPTSVVLANMQTGDGKQENKPIDKTKMWIGE